MAQPKRVSKAEWLQKALEVLSRHGPMALSVERLSRELKTSKSGFYWHFRDRSELIEAIIDYWASEFTEVVKHQPELLMGTPRQRLVCLATMILDDDLARFDSAMMAWAEADPAIRRKVRLVHQTRMDLLAAIFSELGFKGDALEMRTRMFVCYHTWERPMFRHVSKKRLRELINQRIDLLISK